MSTRTPNRRSKRGQAGYALMVVMFLLALLTIAVTAVAVNVVTDARREKEEEMIWRGKQYVRGIRLYYTKMHKFPTQLEDLYKPKTGLRFMRQPYKDPMNPADGSWRMIYIGPNGMLIGSLKNRTTNAAGQATGAFGTAMGSTPGSSTLFGSANGFGSSTSFGSGNSTSNSSSSFGSTGFASSNTSNAAPQASTTASGQPGSTDDAGSLDPQSLQAANLSDGVIMGGKIIGVGSKINKKSIMWYERAKNYLQFEFVWDPSVDSLTGARSTVQVPNGNPLGAFGSSATGNPSSPSPNQLPSPGQNPTPPAGNAPNPGPTDPTAPLQAPPNP